MLLSNENHRTPQEEAAAGGHGTVANFLLKVMEGKHNSKSCPIPGVYPETLSC